MQKKPFLFCGFTVMMGIFGAFLRWVQNMLAFDEGTMLPTENSPWHYILALYLIGFAVFLFFYVRRYKDYSAPTEYPAVFKCENKLWNIGAIAFSVIMALGALGTVIVAVTTERENVFLLILGLFAAVFAIGFNSFVNGTRSRNVKNGGFAGIVMVFFFCYRLIAVYKNYAADPVVWHFAVQLLSVCACLLAFYYISGFAYNSPRKLQTIYFCHLGAFLSIGSCADDNYIGIQLISVATAGILLLLSYAQLANMQPPAAAGENEVRNTKE